MTRSHHHSADARRRIAEATRAAMVAPEVRQRISERTKEGMRRSVPEVDRLIAAWRAAGPSARRAFLNQVLSPVFAREEHS